MPFASIVILRVIALFVFCLAELFVFGAYSSVSHADVLEIHEGDSFETAVENLHPGDTLIVHQGTYIDTGRISIKVEGTADAPVVIKAADGEAQPLIARADSSIPENTINVEGARYLTIAGLEIKSNGGDGVNLKKNPAYVTLEDLHIHNVDVGINLRSNMHQIRIRRNHIHSTGDDGGTGEGIYVGCNYATCVVSDSVIERNWIHDTLQSSQGDGIEIKRGSHAIIVRDNVIHDTKYPCILLYGTDGNPRNRVYGNVVWRCGDSGIQAAADAIIANNIILESSENGFNSQRHQGVTPGNLMFVHNTVVGGNFCLRLHQWADQKGLVFANNAIYCESGRFRISGLRGVTVSGNVIVPAAPGLPYSGFVLGRSLELDFQDAAMRDVYPLADSKLVDAADPAYRTSRDFNGTPRLGLADAGAYTRTGEENPGWAITPGFKHSPELDSSAIESE